VRLQKPVATAAVLDRSKVSGLLNNVLCDKSTENNLYAQIPFCGSLILPIPIFSEDLFERILFRISDIPDVIDFIKESGRLQVILTDPPSKYEGLNYLDPFFQELNPPFLQGCPTSMFGEEKEITATQDRFLTVGKVRFLNFVKEMCEKIEPSSTRASFYRNIQQCLGTYTILKLERYSIAESIENLMIDDPPEAFVQLVVAESFIVEPLRNLRCDLDNYTLEELMETKNLPIVYQPREIHFPCEIGRFLLRKLTYAPLGLRACNDLIDHYNAYDLQKVQTSLNEAIVTNHLDAIFRNVGEISEILENVWNDKTIPNRVRNIQIGVPVSIAALGAIVAGPIGFLAGGFLSELGFKVVEKAAEKYADKLFSVKGEGLTERLAKFRTKSYQVNIYDFKEKYNKTGFDLTSVN